MREVKYREFLTLIIGQGHRRRQLKFKKVEYTNFVDSNGSLVAFYKRIDYTNTFFIKETS